MAVRANIIEIYEISNNKKKIRLIIKHYSYWDGILEACIGNMIEDILDEIRYNRRAAFGDLGVRVQISGTSNPTEKIAINETMLEKAFEDCDFSGGLLDDTDDSEKYIQAAHTIKRIRKDINTFERQFKLLSDDEKQLVRDYITGKVSVLDLCEKWNVEDDTAYKRVERLVAIVKGETLKAMERRKG